MTRVELFGLALPTRQLSVPPGLGSPCCSPTLELGVRQSIPPGQGLPAEELCPIPAQRSLRPWR